MPTLGSHRPMAAGQRLRELLAMADAFVGEPLAAVMDEFGLSREQAESWQRTVGDLAAEIRRELGDDDDDLRDGGCEPGG
jgi:hypothetical protein